MVFGIDRVIIIREGAIGVGGRESEKKLKSLFPLHIDVSSL